MNEYKKMTDESLAMSYMSGDVKAFDEILLRYQSLLFSYFLYMVKNEDEANELFQETFVKVVVHLQKQRYRPIGLFRYWLYRIAHNAITDRLRRCEYRLVKDANADNDLTRLSNENLTIESHESDMIRMQTFDKLHEMVEQLPAEQREIVYLHYFEGLTFREISEIMGISINTALGRMRYAILNLRQTLASKILELEHDSLYNKYKDKVGTVVSAEVYQMWKREVLLIDDEGNELHLPKSEQISRDTYRKGETIKAVVLRVDNENNNPRIILSRTAPIFLKRLLESEVPEVADGLISIRGVARMPGERAKVSVESYDDRIDPVGACVGVKGSRVSGIVRELCNENIDVINYSPNIQIYIQRALAPAEVTSITVDQENKKAEVYLQPDQVSLAIGRSGMNIKLASMLTEYTIDVFRVVGEGEADEDIYLDEFADEIDQWVIDAIKAIGLDTAKAVLNAPRVMLIEKADLEEETVDNVLKVLKAEFEQ